MPRSRDPHEPEAATPAGQLIGRHLRERAGAGGTGSAGGTTAGARGSQHRPTRLERHRANRGRARTGVVVALGLRGLVALAAVAVVVVSGVAWATVRQFTNSIEHGAALPPVAAAAAVPEGQPKPKDIDGKDQNILLLGNDSIAGATPAEVAALGTTTDRSDSATDTMMVMHVPANGSKATVISFPRDTWVDIPGYGYDKLNAAYADAFTHAQSGGASVQAAQSAGILLAAQTISNLTGLHIDHYMQINLLGFYDISEAIGGIDVCLNAAQNPSTEGDASHPDGYSGINLKKGWNYNVKGLQAEAFVRQRHGLPNGDLDRIKRQQYFLSAVFKKVTTAGTLLNIPKMQSVLKAVGKSLFTDPTLNPIQLAQEFQKMAAGNIEFGTIPIVDPAAWEGDQEVIQVDPDAVRAYVDDLVGVPVDPKLAGATVAPSTVSVSVLTRPVSDVATPNAAALKVYGFNATVGDSTTQRATTTIEYPDGQQGQAKTLAADVPGAQLELSSAVTTLTLVLGTDGKQAKSLMPVKPATTAPAAPKPAAPSGVTTATQAAGCIN